jgi:tRNA(fMet)-specific endonuclease VapC
MIAMEKLQTILGSQYLEEYVSSVTVAEIRSLAIQFGWGDSRMEKMNEVLAELPVIDISSSEIIDRYVEIDCYSKRKHSSLKSDFAAINMGKNDLWIAATASVYECRLLTMDLDFQHLHEKFVDVAYVKNTIFE